MTIGSDAKTEQTYFLTSYYFFSTTHTTSLDSYWSKRDVNYPIWGTPVKHMFKKNENRLNSFGVRLEQQRNMRMMYNIFKI